MFYWFNTDVILILPNKCPKLQNNVSTVGIVTIKHPIWMYKDDLGDSCDLKQITDLGSWEGPDWSRSRNSQFWPRNWAYSMRPLTGFFNLTSCNLAHRFGGGGAATDTAMVPTALLCSAASFSISVCLRMMLRKSGMISFDHCASAVSLVSFAMKTVCWWVG